MPFSGLAAPLELTFWVCVALVAYVYAGYPVLIWALSRFRPRSSPPAAPPVLPRLSVLIAAHNEGPVIRERIENLLALDYPPDRLEVIIASDGSTDNTCSVVRSFGSPRVRLLAFEKNRGKATVLNEAVEAACGEILVLSDANTMMDAGAARRLVRWFSDPSVGVVCGRLVLVDAASGSNADGLYWKYETFLKHCEARLGALLGANGAIYAIRRAAYPPLTGRVAVDDFVIPLLARLRTNMRIEYDADAVAFEETAPELRSEFARRSRIGAGGFQSLAMLWPLISPLQGWIALSFVSHKLLRWLCPFFLLGALLSSAALTADWVYVAALALQLALYTTAFAGYRWPQLGAFYRVSKLPTMFVAMNLALLVGFFRFASGRQTGVWARTARSSV